MERRGFIKAIAATSVVGLAGCAGRSGTIAQAPGAPKLIPPSVVPPSAVPPAISPPNHVLAMYAATNEERFPLPAVPIENIAERFWRRRVPYVSKHPAGTIVVDTSNFHLFLVERMGTAMRYGVSLGVAGFSWSGSGVIQFKRAWPTWTPPASMIRRRPELAKWRRGMPPGPKNPLGARALYIFQNGRDTLFRVHGTPDNDSIGVAASSGCVRMMNQDVIDLYGRVRSGAKIVVV